MEILASGQSLVIISYGVQEKIEDNTRSIGKKEALQLKKCQINGYKVPKSKPPRFIIVRKCQSQIMENQNNEENPNIQGNAGEMHQFPIILKPIWLSCRVGKLRNDPRTQLFVDSKPAKPIWHPPKRSTSSFPFPIL